MKTFFTYLFFTLCLSTSFKVVAQSGAIFNDLNGNGVKEAGEPGVSGIVIKSYKNNEANLGSAVSDENGNYTLSVNAVFNQKVRIEFIIPANLSSYKPSTKGNIYGSSVRFVNGNKPNINFAVSNPSQVLNGDPILVHSRYIYGNQVTGQYKDSCVIFGARNSWGNNNSNTSGAYANWNTNSPYRIAFAKEVGSVYGIVYSKKRNKIFTSAFYRQFSGFGPNGPGAIYQIPYNYQTGLRTANPSLMVDVTTLSGQSMPSDPHGTDITNYWSPAPMSTDTRMAMVTKYSLGDLEISDDESKIYTINLHNREVIAINPDNGTLVNRWSIPTSGLTNSLGNVNNNDIRPFGLGYKNGKLYVGAICTGQSTQSNNGTATGAKGNVNAIHAYVWKLDEVTNTFTLVLNFPLITKSNNWNTWQDSWANGVRLIDPTNTTINQPQPILSDIDFYGDDMIIGVRNRLNDQWAMNIFDPTISASTYTYSYGDVLGAKINYTTSKFEIENAGVIGTRVATGNSGTINGYNEFYRGDGATSSGWENYFENASGSFVQVNGGHLASLQNFPCFSMNTWPDGDHSGITWINNQTGAAVKAYATYLGNLWDCPGGKINGMGSIEAIADNLPIEVGNRVWNDVDGNGIQSSDEDGIANVTLEILNASQTIVLGTAITDVEGDYIFDETNVAVGLLPNTTYKIRVKSNNFNNGGIGSLSGMLLTPSNVIVSGNPGVSDNDAVLTNGLAVITFSTNSLGESLHDLDIGFKSSILALSTITNFTAAINKNIIDVKWTTNLEKDVALFEVEKSLDGINWIKLGAITGSLNSISEKNYLLSDINPSLTNINFYRLKIVGTDATFHFSEVRKIRFNNYSQLTIFPNPAKHYTTLSIPEALQKETLIIKIVSSNGQVVKQLNLKNTNSQFKLELDNLSIGLYTVNISTKEVSIQNFKLQIIK